MGLPGVVLAVCMAANRDLVGIGRNRSVKSERGLYGPWESLERGSCGQKSTSEPLSILSIQPALYFLRSSCRTSHNVVQSEMFTF
jgi:hypothetical protein